MAFKKQLVTSCKQAIWGEILGGNAPNYACSMFAVYLHQAFNLIRRGLWTFRHYFFRNIIKE